MELRPAGPSVPGPVDDVAPHRPCVVCHPDPESLAAAVAALFVDAAARAVRARRRFMVALAGGSTPRRAYELLALPPFAARVPWARVHVFWSDERCVDAADALSNQRMARETLLDYVPIPSGQVHPMWCLDEQQTVGGAEMLPVETRARRGAEQYERLLRTLFVDAAGSSRGRAKAAAGLDLVLLGLGHDGHTASLFPGSEALQARERWVAAACDDAGPALPEAGPSLWRITLTAPFISRASSVVFVVSGREKAAIVREVLEGAVDPVRLPAQLIRPTEGDLRWYVDDDSASLLTGTICGGPATRPEPPRPRSSHPGQ